MTMTTQSDDVRKMAQSRDPLKRAQAAASPDLPQDCFLVLSNDSTQEVRLALANNSMTPVGVLKRLKESHDPSVASAAENAYKRKVLKD